MTAIIAGIHVNQTSRPWDALTYAINSTHLPFFHHTWSKAFIFCDWIALN